MLFSNNKTQQIDDIQMLDFFSFDILRKIGGSHEINETDGGMNKSIEYHINTIHRYCRHCRHPAFTCKCGGIYI